MADETGPVDPSATHPTDGGTTDPGVVSPDLVSPELVSPDLVSPDLVSPELVSPDSRGPAGAGSDGEGTAVADVTSPAKVIRIGAMAKQLLEELRATDLDDPAREQLRTIYESSIDQLQSALSPDLAEELERLSFVFGPTGTPTDAEIRLASAQLVGWLEGLFHGIQAMLVAQQVQAQQQLQGMRAQLAERSSPGAGGPGYI